MRSALALTALLFLSNAPAAIADTSEGCFTSSDGLEDQGPYTYQSTGYCQEKCKGKDYAVYALWKGSNCLCGNSIPPSSSKTKDDDCDVSCDGWPQSKCGGKEAYAVFLTGLKSDVSTYSSSSTSTTDGNPTSTDQSAAITQSGQTVVVTAASQTSADASKGSSKPNTAAIAAGVVVGTVGFFALAGAAFFLYRFKKRKSVEDQYRRNAAIDNFGKPMTTNSASDSRFDGDFMAQRRQSNGSIDDDQDFSRRILQVTNPDRR
ncbi:hypothetical protein ASPWEDRAFT_22559 [Aspergillus wentii DTO 134E9]|uniref:WSC domain-containing protein n=1 Tax=Aspergillus wentii DTO 134E9 TaxID=1073089 RepID=A0A1L9RZJ2_ASPWE|nr:uncharacterized protein ASPWEDRAFT_22559 [Aspergillus wentii DTO 134E9]KAI9932793.1 hypothetical protein MW887_009045 [Aspergillus wentii]OJJ40371.1 hypothetical protein ASPWEDRAFT_22559 [Aspergillus wentii DTO 134E9]